MCRNIKTLHNFDPPATSEEVHAAALQYVRKVSGSTKPSKANEAVFARAVDDIAHITAHLLEDLVTGGLVRLATAHSSAPALTRPRSTA